MGPGYRYAPCGLRSRAHGARYDLASPPCRSGRWPRWAPDVAALHAGFGHVRTAHATTPCRSGRWPRWAPDVAALHAGFGHVRTAHATAARHPLVGAAVGRDRLGAIPSRPTAAPPRAESRTDRKTTRLNPRPLPL